MRRRRRRSKFSTPSDIVAIKCGGPVSSTGSGNLITRWAHGSYDSFHSSQALGQGESGMHEKRICTTTKLLYLHIPVT